MLIAFKRLRKMRGENRINFDQRCGLLEGENGFWTSIIPNIYFVEDLNLFKKNSKELK